MAQEIADSKLIDTWSSSGLVVKPDISKIIEGWQLGEQPPHEYMNWLQNTFGSKLNHILKNGVAKWEPEKEFLAGATVQHDGNVWLCKTTNTNSEPTDVNSNWKRIITVESLTTVLAGYVALTGNQTIAGVKTFNDEIIGKSFVEAGQGSGSVALTVNDGPGNASVAFNHKNGIPDSNGSSARITSDVDAATGSLGFLVGDNSVAGTSKALTRILTLAVDNATFTVFPVTPSSAPTTNYQTANKKYVDDANSINSLTSKATPVDTDVIKIQESGGLFKKLTWANLKATLFNGAFSLTVNGYIKFPTVMGGLIIQWGSASTTPSGVTVNFPIAFQYSAFNVQVSSFNTNAVMVTYQAVSRTGALLQAWDANGTQLGSQGVHYFAIGN